MSKHAILRKKQRGISDLFIDIIEHYGNCETAPGGATKIIFGNREYREIVGELKFLLQKFDKMKKGSMVFKDEVVITVYR